MKYDNLFSCCVLLIIIMASSIFSLAYGNSDDVDSLLKKGHYAFQYQNFTGAIYYFDQVLKIDPNNIDALNNKGVVLGNLQNFTGAIYYFDQILKIDPNNIDALNNKGAALIKEEKFDEAALIFDKVLKIEPKNLVALSNKKVVLNRYSPSSKPYDTSRYTLFCQIEIRDKNNHLVSYLEPQIIQIPDPDFFDKILDTWSEGQFNENGTMLTVEKAIIKNNGKNFEKIKFSITATYDSDNAMVSKTGYSVSGKWIIYGYHDGYQLERGDSETLKFTIIRHTG